MCRSDDDGTSRVTFDVCSDQILQIMLCVDVAMTTAHRDIARVDPHNYVEI